MTKKGIMTHTLMERDPKQRHPGVINKTVERSRWHIKGGFKVKRAGYSKTIIFAGAVTLILFFMTLPLVTHSNAMEFIFKDPEYSFQCLRTIGYTVSGAADIGECLSTAYGIKEGDDESWYAEWVKTAQRLEKAADQFLKEGHTVSARGTYFRASNYYRTAEFFLHTNPKDPRILETWGKSRLCFIKAARLSDHPIKPVEIPFEETTLPGYLCLVDNSGIKRPLLIIHSGFDGTAEELYFEVAFFAVKRGYNCLLFEGPGQGRVIREQKIHFRPNWETVVTPVVDFALTLPEVNPERIALMGISMGGYLAPRAVAYEHRIKACIANGGVFNFHAGIINHFPPEIKKQIEKILDNRSASAEFDKEMYEVMKKNTGLRWVFHNGMWTFGAKSPSDYLRLTRPYNLKSCVDMITCNMLVADSEGDKDFHIQAKHLYEALRSPKDYMLFTVKEGAEEHCQMGAMMISNERILNWLDKTLKK